jgi:hypothetical protein
MARILVLTDRPQNDEPVVCRAGELAHRLDATGISAVVTRDTDELLAASSFFGVPDGGLLPHGLSPWTLSIGWNDSVAAERWFARSQQVAAYYGLACETVRVNASFRRTAATVSNLFGLLMVSRDTLFDDVGELVPLRTLWSEVSRPWLIVPQGVPNWQRIVVACTKSATSSESIDLSAWAAHWSRKLNLPVVNIELQRASRSAWSTVARWLPWSSPRCHCHAVRHGLLSFDLSPSDLLLVGREPTLWPFREQAIEVSLSDLVAVSPSTLGVVPTYPIAATRELLFPSMSTGCEHRPATDFVAA